MVNTREKSDHIITLNLTQNNKEIIGTFDMLDGDSGKYYSLNIDSDDLYISPKTNIQEHDIKYLNDIVSYDVFERVKQGFNTNYQDSLLLHEDDLKSSKDELIKEARFDNWIDRIEKGELTFSDKELSLYQEMVNEGYPRINDMEKQLVKEDEVSLNDAEKMLSVYMDRINANQPLVESRTDNQLRSRYELLSTTKDHESNELTMKFNDREDSGFSSKTLSFNKENGLVSEYNTQIVKDHQNMFVPETKLIDTFNINEISRQTISQNIEEEKTITRITRTEGLER
jgi:hypothetical protein